MFLCTTPIPPARAMAIAISDSVTVSIAAETSGMFSVIPRVNREAVLTSLGWVSECRGTRKTSSKVSATLSRTRASPLPGRSPSRNGPLPGSAGAAGRGIGVALVAMAKAKRPNLRRPAGSLRARDLLPAEHLEAAAHPGRKEERRRGEHPRQVQIRELFRVAGPVRQHHSAPRLVDQSLERGREQ